VNFCTVVPDALAEQEMQGYSLYAESNLFSKKTSAKEFCIVGNNGQRQVAKMALRSNGKIKTVFQIVS